MNAMLRAVLATALLAAAAFAPAMAQTEGAAVGTLHVNANPVMVDSGSGNFVSVTGDTTLRVGDKIMIGENGKAALTYNNGYVLHYVSPGVYEVQVAPAGTATAGTGMSTGATVGVILGSAALIGAAIDSKGNVDPIAVSP